MTHTIVKIQHKRNTSMRHVRMMLMLLVMGSAMWFVKSICAHPDSHPSLSVVSCDCMPLPMSHPQTDNYFDDWIYWTRVCRLWYNRWRTWPTFVIGSPPSQMTLRIYLWANHLIPRENPLSPNRPPLRMTIADDANPATAIDNKHVCMYATLLSIYTMSRKN